MDVITAYLYGSLDNNIHMKLPKGFKMPEVCNSDRRDLYSVKLCRSLYGLKQSGRMWYKRLSEYLLKNWFQNDPICLCVFIKRFGSQFIIIVIDVNDLNIIGTTNELSEIVNYFKKEFEMKDLGKTKLCLGL